MSVILRYVASFIFRKTKICLNCGKSLMIVHKPVISAKKYDFAMEQSFFN